VGCGDRSAVATSRPRLREVSRTLAYRGTRQSPVQDTGMKPALYLVLIFVSAVLFGWTLRGVFG